MEVSKGADDFGCVELGSGFGEELVVDQVDVQLAAIDELGDEADALRG